MLKLIDYMKIFINPLPRTSTQSLTITVKISPLFCLTCLLTNVHPPSHQSYLTLGNSTNDKLKLATTCPLPKASHS